MNDEPRMDRPPDPDDIDMIMATMMPERCRNCKFAEFLIGMTLAFESSSGGPWGAFKDIEENCTGLESEPEDSEVEQIELPDGGAALLFGFSDMDGCPYRQYLDGLNSR